MSTNKPSREILGQRASWAAVIIWIVYFLLIPFILSLYLLSPQLWTPRTFPLGNSEVGASFPIFNPTESPMSKSLEYLYGSSLTLNSFKICLQNNNKIFKMKE